MADADDDLDVQVAARFAHLLKPIRDLAENWGVDIANDLEDYLTHLNRTAFTFDGGPKLDFAEAALVIQSSACVYSRKVDFLHTLVYQALEAVRNKKSNHADADGEAGAEGEAHATQRERVSKRDAAEPEDDTMEGFLSAGLNLQQAEDIDLGMEEAPPAAYMRPPAALLALEDQCAGSGDGDAGFCRLAHCFVHVSGALLLDANDAEVYDQLLNNTCATMPTAWMPPDALLKQPTQPGAQPTTNAEDDDDNDGGGMQGGGMSDDEDAPAVTAPAPAQPAAAQPDASQQVAAAGLDAAANAAEQAQPDAQAAAHTQHAGSHAQSDPVLAAQSAVVEEEVFDLYKPLDMDGPGTLPIRPMQVKRPAKGKLKPVSVPMAPTGTSRTAHRNGPAVTLINPEFAYGLELLQQLHPVTVTAKGPRATRAQALRAGAAPARAVFDATDAAAAMADMHQAVEEQQQQEDWAGKGAQGEQTAGWDVGDDGGGDDMGVGQDDDDYGGRDAYGVGLDLMDLVNQGMLDEGGRPRGMSLDDDYGNNSGAGGDEGPSYEDLCRAHIDAMMANAAAQEVQTELAVRVTGWRNKIDPVLRDEEGRRAFDIQLYQQRIIGNLDKKSQDPESVVEELAADMSAPVAFGALAAQSIKWEVSRTFAAMLQLINNRNVSIIRSGSSPDAPFSLQLLNPELLHKTMGQRLAGASAQATAGTEGEAGEDTQMAAVGADAAEDGIEEADEEGEEERPAAAARRPNKKARARG